MEGLKPTIPEGFRIARPSKATHVLFPTEKTPYVYRHQRAWVPHDKLIEIGVKVPENSVFLAKIAEEEK